MPHDVDELRQRVDELERELRAQRDEAERGWGSYHDLRRRRIVRAALAAARVRELAARRLVGRVRKRVPVTAQSSEAAPAEATPPADSATAPAGAAAAAVTAGDELAHAGDDEVAHVWPLGHFYSPVPDTRELAREPARSRVWPCEPREIVGIDWREEEQLALLRNLQSQDVLTLPSEPSDDPTVYHTANPNFSHLDAWTLQAMLRHFQPRRVIEVGCGWSSLVTARVNRECLDLAVDVTCIEPYPPEFLSERSIPGMSRLVVSPVQEVPLERFLELDADDVLFIDTAHVIKTGGDVQFLFHEVVPRLRPGVIVHVHDIFLPWDYPQEWVLGGRAWNEQYLLRSFLSFNDAFEVLFGVAWMTHHHREALVAGLPGGEAAMRDGGGSFWMRRRR
ncbi:class I SAM-dependent methyltransferase [Conexibacter arvalis]|uniref:Putative O-methyltransferase YrrM n=1 Tax=Conexibacter arvalis TaxID=912552 RepID=A0A840IBA4_9ACTN|nr:class I SAM-dependent methyltransferase [Conexibacter arvalis]MBB4661523.1 putative O-methyltransferase YrrM [Conexibacter arvalis]